MQYLPPTEESLVPPRRLGTTFVISVLLIALAKLWLIHGDEIVARNASMDDTWYLQSAKAWYWNRPYDHLAFMRPPVYPLFIALSRTTGIPLRVSSEMLLLAGAFVLAAAMVKVGANRVLGVVVFAAVALSPWSFDVYQHPTPDTIYAPLLLFAIAAMGLTVTSTSASKQLGFSLLAGVSLGLLWLTREEKQLIIPYVACWFIVAIIARPDERRGWRRLKSDILTTLLIPALVIAALVGGVSAANYAKWGVFATSEVATSGFENANRALVRIKPQNWIRFVPVTTEVRNRAFEISPTFGKLKPVFENKAELWTRGTKDMGIDNEIAAPWFFWYFREVVSISGFGDNSARESNAYYQKIADEINAACDDGRVPSRQTINPFVDPEINRYAAYFPESFIGLFKMFWHRQVPRNDQFVIETDELQEATPQLQAIYDDMCQRRVSRPRAGEIQLTGWAFNVADPVVRVEIQGRKGKMRTAITDFSPRHDVITNNAQVIGIPEDTGFSGTSVLWPAYKRNGILAFVLQSGAVVSMPFKVNFNGQIVIEQPADMKGVAYHLDRFIASPLENQKAVVAQYYLWQGYGWAVFGLSYAAGVALTVLLIQFVVGLFTNPHRPRGPLVAFALIIAFVVAGRLALFTLVDASSGHVNWTLRYIYPVAPLYTALVIIVIWQAGASMADLRDAPLPKKEA